MRLMNFGVMRACASSGWKESIAVFCVCFAVAVAFQWLGGAYSSEFSGCPDEAAHYVTGLMVHDYISQTLGTASPRSFAESYYLHYPKVAIGHWPPCFYLLQAADVAVFGETRASLLLCMAAITGAFAATVYRMVRPDHNVPIALLMALLAVGLPVVQWSTAKVMSDILLATLILWACLRFGSYLESPNYMDAALAGLFASLALLTKPSAFLLVLVFPVAILVTRRYRIVRTLSFWLPVVIILALSGPWYYVTAHLLSSGLESTTPSLGYTVTKIAPLFTLLVKLAGPILLVGAVLGLIARIAGSAGLGGKRGAMLALLIGTVVFLAIVPNGVERRYLIPAIPAILLFLSDALAAGADHLKAFRLRPLAATAVPCALVVLAFGVEVSVIPNAVCRGFREALNAIGPNHTGRDGVLLVSSDESGEGALISEVARADKRPDRIVLRSSKVLTSSDWQGRNHKAAFSSADAIGVWLRKAGVGIVVIDASIPNTDLYGGDRLLASAVASNTSDWLSVGCFDRVCDGVIHPKAIRVYRARDIAPRTFSRIRMPMKDSLGEDLVVELRTDADAPPDVRVARTH